MNNFLQTRASIRIHQIYCGILEILSLKAAHFSKVRDLSLFLCVEIIYGF